MNFLEHFYRKTLKYELVNKFPYKNTQQLPELKKIILNFGCNTNDIKKLAAGLVGLQLISNQKGTLTTAKKPNLSLKIRKGNPVGCKITLKKTKIFNFLIKTISEVFPKIKNFTGFPLKKKLTKTTFSFEIYDTFSFNELENNYHLFNNNLPKLTITIIVSYIFHKELLFIIKSLQIPLK